MRSRQSVVNIFCLCLTTTVQATVWLIAVASVKGKSLICFVYISHNQVQQSMANTRRIIRQENNFRKEQDCVTFALA
jgi:5-methylcytosine-specific restriction endonuclease McrA